ncbi:hypothetical protein S40285_00484 [Stachybotrys chlorohalonatus IBT 40285]|uniref:Uncharacterized protein n=1 Tax=Stachybotrys chlorohalonatus (strain IBT 40285) TaxID=1283841 RepID=A0A084QNE5_STAC4|nr:hypothetical protein S40285_00484 [Stachybotrys chlorohalonata IBT 40285]
MPSANDIDKSLGIRKDHGINWWDIAESGIQKSRQACNHGGPAIVWTCTPGVDDQQAPMSKYKDMMKNGWHPEKPGSNLRGQVSGMLGRNKSNGSDGSDHVAQPLSSLRDPSSFAPPPKRTGSGLAPAPPKTAPAPRKVVTAPSKYQDPRAPTAAEPAQQYQQPQDEGVTEPPAPRPYRTNTSGLSTDHLPRPPGRRDGAGGMSPPPPSYDSVVAAPAKACPPRLPPRLPPRTGSGGSTPVQSPSPTGGAGVLNQGAINRLGAAGVSVPALGIGASPGPATEPSPMSPLPPRAGGGGSSHVDELQNRFSGLRTTAPTNPPSNQGTTWAQKQAALKTASSFQKDPSSVSLADARSAASTANNFRQRHGDQVAAGLQSANNINQKYGVADRLGGGVNQGQHQNVSPVDGQVTGGAFPAKKKPPPPPVKRKPVIPVVSSPTAETPDDGTPPPIPLSTRPTF